jgi:hypothetical protein
MREILPRFLSGSLEILPDGAILQGPGSIVGEMRARSSARCRCCSTRPIPPPCGRWATPWRIGSTTARLELAWLLARLLARRLNAGTSYLADLKWRFSGFGNHLEMVGEALKSLLAGVEHPSLAEAIRP